VIERNGEVGVYAARLAFYRITSQEGCNIFMFGAENPL
jgi:hypothetical protein